MERDSQTTTEPTEPVFLDMNSAIEIYKQKYENFRHFDRLRWQAPGLALAIAAGVFAFSAREGATRWLLSVLWILLGFLSWLCALVMWRISLQLERNRKALEEVAKFIHDYTIPERSKFGAIPVFLVFLVFFGIGCLIAGITLID